MRAAEQGDCKVDMNYHTRPTVADMRAKKARGETFTMLFVETHDEARAAAAAGIDMLSIMDSLWTPQMREAAGNCFVQVGLIYGELVTTEDYLRAAHRVLMLGADCAQPPPTTTNKQKTLTSCGNRSQ